jgi:hypothetical protein
VSPCANKPTQGTLPRNPDRLQGVAPVGALRARHEVGEPVPYPVVSVLRQHRVHLDPTLGVDKGQGGRRRGDERERAPHPHKFTSFAKALIGRKA